MYWTDWGSEPKIERAGMDGSHRQTIVSYDIKWPNGLTLDLVLKKIYWADAKLNAISSCNYDGSNRRVVLFSLDVLKHPFSITTFEDWVYWTDWEKQAVFKANKFSGKDIGAVTATHMVRRAEPFASSPARGRNFLISCPAFSTRIRWPSTSTTRTGSPTVRTTARR